jgi:hypothetical protein
VAEVAAGTAVDATADAATGIGTGVAVAEVAAGTAVDTTADVAADATADVAVFNARGWRIVMPKDFDLPLWTQHSRLGFPDMGVMVFAPFALNMRAM